MNKREVSANNLFDISDSHVDALNLPTELNQDMAQALRYSLHCLAVHTPLLFNILMSHASNIDSSLVQGNAFVDYNIAVPCL